MNYRKAMFSDIDDISYLVTDLLGTCNINKNNISVSKIDILIKLDFLIFLMKDLEH